MKKEDKQSTLFFYLGAFFIMAASLSIGVLIVLWFLIKLGGPF
ncbi:hypothetical protein [Flavobacterium sp. ZS1P14]